MAPTRAYERIPPYVGESSPSFNGWLFVVAATDIRSAMATTRFEILLEKAKADCVTAIFAAPLGDSHLHSRIKGEKIGLERAAVLYRQSLRAEDDEEMG